MVSKSDFLLSAESQIQQYLNVNDGIDLRLQKYTTTKASI
jgi:hypothetical protein